MSNNKEERDERARRALDEARELIENPPDYIFRRAYLDKKGAPEFATPEPEPKPDDLTTALEQRHAQAPSATESAWEAWIQTRIAEALSIEREWTAEVMSEAIGLCMARERRELQAQVAQLRRERERLNKCDAAFERAMARFEEACARSIEIN